MCGRSWRTHCKASRAQIRCVRLTRVRWPRRTVLRRLRPPSAGCSPQTTAVASALKEVVRSRGAAPLHIMVAKGHGTRNSSDLIRHRSVAAFPRQAFIKVAPGVFVCSPELVFVQMASSLTRGGLLAVGYELCGCYPLGEERVGALVRRPLSSPRRLTAFAARAKGLAGVKVARSAAKQVLAKSGSLMETEVSIIAFSLFSQGGLGLRASSERTGRIVRPREDGHGIEPRGVRLALAR